eukprot:TRINITY_DN1068_c0_g1_i11.p1 TRINITY_DN1068_c0_g1~~TRINITY_DN1068_c0_g1_i11.p1  ORF type:complete len:529 (+),score=123.68 TRINITY_DN1068_c0_g1_i11:1764-3350(+)
MISFAVYTIANGTLTASVAFTALSLFDILQMPLAMLPMCIGAMVSAKVSFDRISKFLESDELPLHSNQTIKQTSPAAVGMEEGTFEWTTEQPFLKGITLEIQPGELVAVVGEVGAGKSSLLMALLGEMPKVSGRVLIWGSVAFVSQQAWIKNATIQDNVLFGGEDDKKRYKSAIKVCQLEKDLQILPGGHLTEIGEKGINLSGGQKQRVSLARAVYSDADIYLLDDPLSAVDAHVGKAIFKECIKGALNGKTIILVTHQLQYLKKCDKIIMINAGTIESMGTYDYLMENYEPFSKLINAHVNKEEENKGEKEDGEEKKEDKEKKQKLIEEEERNMGKVSWRIYVLYYSYAGKVGVFMSLFALAAAACSVSINYWLTYWTNVVDYSLVPNNTEASPVIFSDLNMGVYFYLLLYALFGAGQALFFLSQTLVNSIVAVKAAKDIYKGMLKCVLRTPSSFFDITPIGRILNRFGGDQHTVDVSLPGPHLYYINNPCFVEHLDCVHSDLLLSKLKRATKIRCYNQISHICSLF